LSDRRVANQATRDEPEPTQASEINAELGGVGLTRATLAPGVSCHQELLAGYIKNVVFDVQPVPPYFVELRIDENPALLISVPVFADPVVFEERGLK
jgi:hypothetical protein